MPNICPPIDTPTDKYSPNVGTYIQYKFIYYKMYMLQTGLSGENSQVPPYPVFKASQFGIGLDEMIWVKISEGIALR